MLTHSIIIPTYNRTRLLRRAVSSAIAAAGSSGEVIVVDDGSDIPAEDVVSDIRFERLRVIRNPKPLAGGGSPSRNCGADAAKGPVLFFLDDDDELLEGYCATVLSDNVQNQSNFGFSARQFASAVEDDTSKSRTEKRTLRTGVIPSSADFKEKTFPFSAGFWMTKKTFEAIGPMETGLRTNSDTEYCCRLYSSELPGWYSETPGVRVHEVPKNADGQTSSVTKRTRSNDRAAAFRFIANKHRDFLSAEPSAGLFVYARIMKHSLRAGRTREAAAAAFSYANATVRRMTSRSP